jgi:hypothetical protein
VIGPVIVEVKLSQVVNKVASSVAMSNQPHLDQYE